nr:hypothetical protein CFP56_21296 [Quercus suber]
MANVCSTPVSILILTLRQNLEQQVYARNNRAALIGTLGAFSELPEVEYLWYGIRNVHSCRHDQLTHVTAAKRPAFPVDRLLPFLAVQPHGAPSVVFDVTLPCLPREFVQHSGKSIDLDCTVDVAHVEGRRTEVGRSMGRLGGYHGLANVFHDGEAYRARAWGSQIDGNDCRIWIDVRVESRWDSVLEWFGWRKQDGGPPAVSFRGEMHWPWTESDSFCVRLENPVAMPGVRQMPSRHTIVVPFVRPKPALCWRDEGSEEERGEAMIAKEMYEMMREEKDVETEDGDDGEWDLVEAE